MQVGAVICSLVCSALVVLCAPIATSDCIGTLHCNHDGSFENGYCWPLPHEPPSYIGAFGEGYELGHGMIECGVFWFTQLGDYSGELMDVYVWAGGVNDHPRDVLCVVPDVDPGDIAFWPELSRHDVAIGFEVDGEFTVGFWPHYVDESCTWYIGGDENGFGGHPWTCAPITGRQFCEWHHVSWYWPNCISLGIAIYFDGGPSAVESPTWGKLKSVFR